MSYTQVSAGCVHTVLLRSDGSVVTFGGNDVEQCDIPSCAMLDLQKWLIIFLGCFLFFGLMRCESYNTNKFNIMFHVCSLVVMSESPLNFKLQQERIKTCNSKPNSFFKKLFKGSWRCPVFLKNQSGKLPEPSNSPINWKQVNNLSKPNASQKRVLWREMKGIWEKEGKT